MKVAYVYFAYRCVVGLPCPHRPELDSLTGPDTGEETARLPATVQRAGDLLVLRGSLYLTLWWKYHINLCIGIPLLN